MTKNENYFMKALQKGATVEELSIALANAATHYEQEKTKVNTLKSAIQEYMGKDYKGDIDGLTQEVANLLDGKCKALEEYKVKELTPEEVDKIFSKIFSLR